MMAASHGTLMTPMSAGIDSTNNSSMSHHHQASRFPAPPPTEYQPPPPSTDYNTRPPSNIPVPPQHHAHFSEIDYSHHGSPRAEGGLLHEAPFYISNGGVSPASLGKGTPSPVSSSSRQQQQQRRADKGRRVKQIPNAVIAAKTRLCANYEKGTCTSTTCSFAHGNIELRKKPDLRKTKLCDSFTSTNTCAKGSECTYAHGVHELQATSEYFKTSICPSWRQANMPVVPSVGHCDAGAHCRHAHGSQELRTRAPIAKRSPRNAVEYGEETPPSHPPASMAPRGYHSHQPMGIEDDSPSLLSVPSAGGNPAAVPPPEELGHHGAGMSSMFRNNGGPAMESQRSTNPPPPQYDHDADHFGLSRNSVTSADLTPYGRFGKQPIMQPPPEQGKSGVYNQVMYNRPLAGRHRQQWNRNRNYPHQEYGGGYNEEPFLVDPAANSMNSFNRHVKRPMAPPAPPPPPPDPDHIQSPPHLLPRPPPASTGNYTPSRHHRQASEVSNHQHNKSLRRSQTQGTEGGGSLHQSSSSDVMEGISMRAAAKHNGGWKQAKPWKSHDYDPHTPSTLSSGGEQVSNSRNPSHRRGKPGGSPKSQPLFMMMDSSHSSSNHGPGSTTDDHPLLTSPHLHLSMEEYRRPPPRDLIEVSSSKDEGSYTRQAQSDLCVPVPDFKSPPDTAGTLQLSNGPPTMHFSTDLPTVKESSPSSHSEQPTTQQHTTTTATAEAIHRSGGGRSGSLALPGAGWRLPGDRRMSSIEIGSAGEAGTPSGRAGWGARANSAVYPSLRRPSRQLAGAKGDEAGLSKPAAEDAYPLAALVGKTMDNASPSHRRRGTQADVSGPGGSSTPSVRSPNQQRRGSRALPASCSHEAEAQCGTLCRQRHSGGAADSSESLKPSSETRHTFAKETRQTERDPADMVDVMGAAYPQNAMAVVGQPTASLDPLCAVAEGTPLPATQLLSACDAAALAATGAASPFFLFSPMAIPPPFMQPSSLVVAPAVLPPWAPSGVGRDVPISFSSPYTEDMPLYGAAYLPPTAGGGAGLTLLPFAPPALAAHVAYLGDDSTASGRNSDLVSNSPSGVGVLYATL